MGFPPCLPSVGLTTLEVPFSRQFLVSMYENVERLVVSRIENYRLLLLGRSSILNDGVDIFFSDVGKCIVLYINLSCSLMRNVSICHHKVSFVSLGSERYVEMINDFF